jgi:hypothetical protein
LTAAWVPLGPAQTLTPAYGPVTGRVTSIAIDTGSDPGGNTVYVGTTGGGVWKSTNAAGPASQVSFVPMTDGVPAMTISGAGSLSIGAVTVQPGGTGVVLAGTGDSNDALDSYYGEGILRSADAGGTWTTVNEAGLNSIATASFIGLGVAGFAWGTANPDFVVVALTQSLDGTVVNALSMNSAEGLYYSADAGKTWQLATIWDGPNAPVHPGVGGSNGDQGNAVTAVVWNPMRQMFIAALRHHGYYGSSDGMTWTRLPNQPGGSILSQLLCPTAPASPACPMFRGALAVQPVTGDTFAFTVAETSTVAGGNPDEGIWREVCGGTCTPTSPMNFVQVPNSLFDNSYGAIPQGDYDLWLAAVPAGGNSTDTLLFAGTEDIFKCSLAEGCVWRNATNVNTCAAAAVAPSQHAVAANGALMFFGNDSGLWRTTDGINESPTPCTPDDAKHFDNLNPSLGSLAEVMDIAQDPGHSGILIAAQGGNGTSATSNASTAGAWPQVLDGYSAYVSIDPTNALNWYASSGYGVSIDHCPDGSACDAALFPVTPLVGDAQTASDGEQLENPAVWMIDPQDSTQMIVGTCRVWRGSVAGGVANWSATNALSGMLDGDNGPTCDGNAQIRSLGASGTLSAIYGSTQEILYVGMDGTDDGGLTASGHVYTTSVAAGATGKTSWTDLFTSPVVNDVFANQGQFNPGGFAVSSIVADTHDPSGQTVYATIQGTSGNGVSEPTVYLSTNQGQSWTNITANLPDVPVNALIVDPGDAQIVYVATDAGIYATTAVSTCSTGQLICWSPLGTAMPDVPVPSLATWGTGAAGILRAATYGRGIWQTALLSVQELSAPQTTVTMTPEALVFGPQAGGTLSPSQSIIVTNSGTNALLISATQIGANFNEQDDCNAPIAVGSSCTVTIEFSPGMTGPIAGEFSLRANVPGGSATVALSGTGTAAVPGQPSLTPQALSFGGVLKGTTTSPPQYIVVANNAAAGSTSITLQTPTVTSDYEITGNTCTSPLAAQTSCTIGVVFSPTKTGADNGTFSIAIGSVTFNALLTGKGLAPATDAVSPSALQFSPQTVGTESAAQTVTISNSGGVALTSISAASNSTAFAVTSTCITQLPANQSCAVSVTFQPTAPGVQAGALTIADVLNGTAHMQAVSLSGTGVAPKFVASIGSVGDFGAEGVVGESGYNPSTLTSLSLPLTNNGSAAIDNLTFPTTGNFTVANGTCGNSLPAGAACAAQVTFVPTFAGPQTGTVTVAGSNLGQSLTAVLTGTGMEFSMAPASPSTFTLVSGASTTYTVSLLPGGNASNPWSGSLSLGCNVTPAGSGYTCTVPTTAVLASGNSTAVTVTAAPANTATNALSPVSLVLGCVLPLLLRSRRRNWALLAGALLVVLCGCGVKATGGGSGGGGGGGGGTGTNYTLTLTASAPGVQQSVSMTLVIER